MKHISKAVILSSILVFACACGIDTIFNDTEPYPYYEIVEELEEPLDYEYEEIYEPELELYYNDYYDELEESEIEPPQYLQELTLEGAISRANWRRSNIVRPCEERLLALSRNHEQVEGPIDLTMFSSRSVLTPPNYIATEDAIYDVYILFELLRDIYGAYEYFGGDEVFYPLLYEIIDALYTQEWWQTTAFIHILRDKLSQVIRDNHVWISGQPLGAFSHLFVWEEEFERGENGFKHKLSGRYVTRILGYNKNDVFRLSMDEEGNLFYLPIIIQESDNQAPSTLSLNIVFEDGEEEIMLHSQTRHRVSHENSHLLYREDIPVVTVRAMGWPDADNNNLNDPWNSQCARNFLSFANDLRYESAVVIDIRSNRGGNAILATMFLHELLGEIVPRNYTAIWQWDTFLVPHEWYDFTYTDEEVLDTYVSFNDLGDGHIFSVEEHDYIVENNRLIILLVDRFTASAGDEFASRLLRLENSLIIGQNTAGVLLTDMFVGNMYLPNSGEAVVFGPSLFVHPDGVLKEGVGVVPDIWVMGDALEAALALLEREN